MQRHVSLLLILVHSPEAKNSAGYMCSMACILNTQLQRIACNVQKHVRRSTANHSCVEIDPHRCPVMCHVPRICQDLILKVYVCVHVHNSGQPNARLSSQKRFSRCLTNMSSFFFVSHAYLTFTNLVLHFSWCLHRGGVWGALLADLHPRSESARVRGALLASLRCGYAVACLYPLMFASF
jgi:hypothetical protein